MTRYTAAGMNPAIGELVQWCAPGGSLFIDAYVIDCKAVWGRNRVLVAPVSGDGVQWVDIGHVRPVAYAARAAAAAAAGSGEAEPGRVGSRYGYALAAGRRPADYFKGGK